MKNPGRNKIRKLTPEQDALRYADRLYLRNLEQDRTGFDMGGYGRGTLGDGDDGEGIDTYQHVRLPEADADPKTARILSADGLVARMDPGTHKRLSRAKFCKIKGGYVLEAA